MNPSFNNLDLVDLACSETLRPPRVRTVRQRLPDVAGACFQLHPPGEAGRTVGGMLCSTVQATAELAAADLRAAVAARQQQVGVVGTYRDADGAAHSSALLAAYRQAGPLRITKAPGGFQALLPVEAELLTQP